MEVFDDVGRFDEELLIGEDTLMAQRLGERGVPILFEPAARTAHHGPVGLRGLVRDQVRRGARFVEANQVEDPGRGNRMMRLAREAARSAGVVRMAMTLALRERAWWVVRSLPWIVAGDLALRLGRWRAFNGQG